jgi:glycosyltransferase involved in cell wall biosynthesis
MEAAPIVNEQRSQPLVSFVIPTYNRGYCIGQTIRSILQQTYRNIEIIVLDDGSVDDTPQVIKSFDNPRIVYYRFEENMGHPVRMKFGMEKAQGELFVFFGSDDVLAYDSIIEETVTLIPTLEDDVWVISYLVECAARGQVRIDFDEQVVNLTEYLKHPHLSKLDVLHFYKRQYLDAFLEIYNDPYTFFTSFLEVYLRHNCRQALRSKVGAIAGFNGDNITKGKGAAKYDIWAEQTAIHQYQCFKQYKSVHETDWWRNKMLSALYWTLAGCTISGAQRYRLSIDVYKSYNKTLGIDFKFATVCGYSLLPLGLPKKIRLLRNRLKSYRQ